MFTKIKKINRLNLDSSQFGQLGNQQFQQGSEQAFAPDADVMDELKEAQVKRQFFLRDAPMGSQPGAQQRPEALGGVDVNLMEAVSVFIAGVLAPAVAHGTVVKTPFRQTAIDVVFIGMNLCTRRDEPLDQRTDRDLLDIVQHPHDDGTASLDHAEDRWLFAFQRAAPPRPFQAPSPAPPPFFSLSPDAPYARPPRRLRRIPLPPSGSVQAGGQRFRRAIARSSAAHRPSSTLAPGRSGRWIGSTP